MKFYATTRCPVCGYKQVLHLNGTGFLKKETTNCASCGQTYSTMFNCLVKTTNIEEARNKAEQGTKIASFSTEELEKELARRSVSM